MKRARATAILTLAAVLGAAAGDEAVGDPTPRAVLGTAPPGGDPRPTPKARLVAGRPTPTPVSRFQIARAIGTLLARPTPTPLGGGQIRALPHPNQQPPYIMSPSANQVFPAGGQMLIKLTPYPGSSVTKYDVELQKKVSGVWQAWTSLTYDSAANPNGVYQQTGTQNPERRLRARSQAINNAQWTGWVDFALQ